METVALLILVIICNYAYYKETDFTHVVNKVNSCTRMYTITLSVYVWVNGGGWVEQKM